MEITDQAFLEYVIKMIVTKPDAVIITRTVDDLGVLITLKVDKEDMGRIIGKDGQTAKAIRTLLRVIGSRNNERVNMKILEPEGGDERFAAPAEEAPADDIVLSDDLNFSDAPKAPAEEVPAAEEPKSDAPHDGDETPASEGSIMDDDSMIDL